MEDFRGTAEVAGPTGGRRRAYARKDDVVLEAAERVFLKHGYANTSMDAIADKAGVSKRTIYSNFENKAALFAAVIQKRCKDVLPGGLSKVDVNTKDPEGVLVELGTQFLTAIYTRPEVQLYQTVVAASRRFPELGKIMFDGPIRQAQLVFDEFLRVQARLGHLKFPDIDIAASHLVGLLKTDVHMQLTFTVPTKLTKDEIAASVRSSVRLFLYGAIPRD